MRRLPSDPLPCRTPQGCPRGSPARELEFRLSRKNWRTVELYRRVRLLGAACLTAAERADELLAGNLAIVHEVWGRSERRRDRELLAAELQHIILPLLRR